MHVEGHAEAGRSGSVRALKGVWKVGRTAGVRKLLSGRQVWPTARGAAPVLGVLVGRTQLSLPAWVLGPRLSLLL